MATSKQSVKSRPEDFERTLSGKSSSSCSSLQSNKARAATTLTKTTTGTRALPKPSKVHVAGMMPSETGAGLINYSYRRGGNTSINVDKHRSMYTSKLCLSSLPDELLLKIFSFLCPGDLLVASRVDKRWLNLTRDNTLWKRIYAASSKTKDEGANAKIKLMHSKDRFCEDYRKKYFSGCSQTIDVARISAKLRKIDSFSGLPAATCNILDKMSIRWVLAFVDDHNREVCEFNNDSTSFSTTLSVRWYNLINCSLTHRDAPKSLRIYAARPVLTGLDGKASPGSPYRRSLVYEIQVLALSAVLKTSKPVHADDTLSLFDVTGNGRLWLMLATWKDSQDVAFITIAFHRHRLVEYCLYGTPHRPYSAPQLHVPQSGDVDADYGLHGFICVIEIRSQKQSIWRERFNNVHCKRENIAKGAITLQLINPLRSYQRSQLNPSSSSSSVFDFLWRTEYMRGKLANLCIADVCVFDEHANVMRALTAPMLAAQSADVLDCDYNAGDLDARRELACERDGCGLNAVIVRDDSTGYCYVSDLYITLSLSVINDWFSTAY